MGPPFFILGAILFFAAAIKERFVYADALQAFGRYGVAFVLGDTARKMREAGAKNIAAQKQANECPTGTNIGSEKAAEASFAIYKSRFWYLVGVAYRAGLLENWPNHFTDYLTWGLDDEK